MPQPVALIKLGRPPEKMSLQDGQYCFGYALTARLGSLAKPRRQVSRKADSHEFGWRFCNRTPFIRAQVIGRPHEHELFASNCSVEGITHGDSPCAANLGRQDKPATGIERYGVAFASRALIALFAYLPPSIHAKRLTRTAVCWQAGHLIFSGEERWLRFVQGFARPVREGEGNVSRWARQVRQARSRQNGVLGGRASLRFANEIYMQTKHGVRTRTSLRLSRKLSCEITQDAVGFGGNA
jgi:hypothetical protein